MTESLFVDLSATHPACPGPLTVLVSRLLALPASLLLLLLALVEDALGLGRLLQAHHESLHVVKAVVQNFLKISHKMFQHFLMYHLNT